MNVKRNNWMNKGKRNIIGQLVGMYDNCTAAAYPRVGGITAAKASRPSLTVR